MKLLLVSATLFMGSCYREKPYHPSCRYVGVVTKSYCHGGGECRIELHNPKALDEPLYGAGASVLREFGNSPTPSFQFLHGQNVCHCDDTSFIVCEENEKTKHLVPK